MNPRVSVVIATYDRPALLLRCIDALLAQTLPAADYEIIVVDDGSPRATRERLLAEFWTRRRRGRAATLRFLWLPVNRGPAAARNHGILASRGAVIAFTDDDTRPAIGWLREGLSALAGFVDGRA